MRQHYPLDPVTGIENANLSWVNGNPATGANGSYPPFGLFVDPQAEILAAQRAGGLSDSADGSDTQQLAQAISRGAWLGTLGQPATVNDLVAALPSGVTWPQILIGMEFSGILAQPNTGAMTVILTGFGLPPGKLNLVNRNGLPLLSGDVPSGVPVRFRYVGGAYRMVGVTSSELIGATYITSAITKTVGGTSPDFADLNAAYQWLSSYRITLLGSVTFQLAGNAGAGNALQHVYNTSVSLYHPDGARVTIKGGTLRAAQTAATALAYTGNTSTARGNDKTSNLTTLRAVYATEIVLQGGASLSGSGFLGNFQDILVSSDGTGGSTAFSWISGNLSITRSAFAGAGGAGLNIGSSYCALNGIVYAFGNAGTGAGAALGGQIALASGSTLITAGNGGSGIQAAGAQVKNFDGGSGTIYSRANGGDGAYLSDCAALSVPATAVFYGNVGNGLTANGASVARVAGSQSGANGGAGFVSSNGGSYVDASNTTGPGNGTYGYFALNGAFLSRPGGTATGATAAASPTVGSVGNSNATLV